MASRNCNRLKDIWCTRKKQQTVWVQLAGHDFHLKKKNPTRLIQKKVTQGGSTAVIPTVSTSIIRSPALVGWKNTTEPGDRGRICLRKCGWKVAFCMQSPPITNHSLSLQLSVRRSVSSNKRLPKLSPGMMHHVSPRKRSSFPPERRPTSRIAAGPSAKSVIKRTYRQLYSHYDFHAYRHLIRTLFITTGLIRKGQAQNAYVETVRILLSEFYFI